MQGLVLFVDSVQKHMYHICIHAHAITICYNLTWTPSFIASYTCMHCSLYK